jgi:indolepyruvate ferredoxin oxidoreductase beta subunit
MIISVEPMESLRYLPMLAPNGWLITNTTPHINIPDYPDFGDIMSEIEKVQNHITIDADNIAKDLGSKRSANMVILGAAAPFLGLDYDDLKKAIAQIFKRKGQDMIDINLKALQAGFEFSKKAHKK